MLAGMALICRQLVSRINPATGEPVISNWPTQLLGNRPMTGKLTFTIAGKKKSHAIANFQPARDLKTGEPMKSKVGNRRRGYEAGLPEKVASKEWLNVFSYFILSAMTGRLPTPNDKGYSAESTLKASIAHGWIGENDITLNSATASNPDNGLEVTHSGDALMGILLAYVENKDRVNDWAVKESSRAGDIEAEDWSLI